MSKKTESVNAPAPPLEPLVGNGEAPDNIPSATPGNLLDLERFVDDDDALSHPTVKRVRCALERPDNYTRFRTWPDMSWWRIFPFLAKKRSGQNETLFLVDRGLLDLDELDGRIKRKRLIPYITRSGSLGLWPVGVDESNPYVSTALHICQLAINEWACAVTQGRQDGEYKYKAPNPNKNYGEPNWPQGLTMNELVTLAFPRDRLILTPDHPELVRLRDED